tara:strand:+ start:75 stop:566 length:492 start_codon:yes stop_codon:yes gene_type:complete
MEEFRDIKNYEGRYQVSNLGRVKSLARKDSIGRRVNEKVLKPVLKKRGYLELALSKDGKATTRKIHQLVAEAFLGHVPCGHAIEVDHINEDKLNNRLDNLQLLSSAEHRGKGSSSKYTGVCWHKKIKKWQACIYIKPKRKHLGYFTCELEAAKTCQKALSEII